MAVRNTGAGIPANEMPQIFERFYKSDRSRSLDKNGMGLGLSICKSIIRAHGGTIEGRNSPPKGAVFIITLPKEEP